MKSNAENVVVILQWSLQNALNKLQYGFLGIKHVIYRQDFSNAYSINVF
jgi:hypothetical protein